METLDAKDKGLGEKWSQVNDELSEACVVKNDDKGVESKDITRVKPVKNLKGKAVDSSVRPRIGLRTKLEIEAGPNLT